MVGGERSRENYRKNYRAGRPCFPGRAVRNNRTEEPTSNISDKMALFFDVGDDICALVKGKHWQGQIVEKGLGKKLGYYKVSYPNVKTQIGCQL